MSSIHLPFDIYTHILDTLPAKIMIISSEGQVLYRNNSWNSLSDSENSLQSYSEILDLIHPVDAPAAKEMWLKGIDCKMPFEQINRLKTSSGDYRWHLERYVRIGENWLGTFTDVHELKSREDMRRKLISGYSHDLRTPLTSSKLKAQLAAKQSNDSKIIDIASQISKDMDRADKLIRDMLDTDRWESGRNISLQFTNFDLAEYINTILYEYRLIYGERFLFNQPKDCIGWWDQEAIKRIMDNLLSNAMKYSDRGSIIEVKVRKNATHIVFAINNKGKPIPKDIMPTLFFAFERGKSRQTLEGWGLGLSVVIELCHSHGGVVDVESTLEAGTTFTVSLPLDSRPKMLAPV